MQLYAVICNHMQFLQSFFIHPVWVIVRKALNSSNTGLPRQNIGQYSYVFVCLCMAAYVLKQSTIPNAPNNAPPFNYIVMEPSGNNDLGNDDLPEMGDVNNAFEEEVTTLATQFLLDLREFAAGSTNLLMTPSKLS